MITASDLAEVPLFAALPHALRSRLASRAADIHVNAGEFIVNEGDPPYFWVVLAGEVEVVKIVAAAVHQISTFDAGEYFGEVPLMLTAPAFAGVRALQPSRLARIDPSDFHAMVTESSDAGAMLAQSLVRRVGVIRDAYAATSLTQATIVGSRYDLLCHDVRDFLSRNQIGFEWVDPEDPADAECMPPQAQGRQTFPLVVLADGTVLESPTERELAEALHLQTVPASDDYDVVIVGAGPAGLAAAVYGGSEGLKTILIEREAPGGQAGTSSRIENYLGFPGGVSGADLANRAFMQATRFDTEILVTRSVEGVVSDGRGGLTVRLDGGDAIRTRAVVVATGVSWRKHGAEGADALIGRGVFYGAARTEALATRGKNVFLIGGGNSAGQAAMFFSSYAESVTILIRGASLEKTMSHYLIEQLKTKENIRVEARTVLTAVRGDTHLQAIVTRDEESGETHERQADAVFVFIGADAETAWLDCVQKDARGYLCTGQDIADWTLERPPYRLETSVPGIFAVGDVRSNSIKRVASGVGEGSMVIAFIHEYLALAKTPAPA
jgi:thioredoxin reductase (NADPH)